MVAVSSTHRIGIDLGGTKIAGVLLDDSAQVAAEFKVATPQGDYSGTVAAIVSLVNKLEAHCRGAWDGVDCPVGIGTPGVCLVETGLMTNCNSTCLNGQPLLADLRQHLGDRVTMANDADCFALSEWRLRAELHGIEGGQTLFGLILGTGVGAGIVVNGQLLFGPNGLAGEWGHMPLPYFQTKSSERTPPNKLEWKLAPRTCYCGRINCIETFLSGPGLVALHEELWQERMMPEQLTLHWPESRSGNAEAAVGVVPIHSTVAQRSQATLELYLDMLSRSLAQVINLLDPQTIVIGGGLGSIAFLYQELPRRIPAYLFSRTSSRNQIVAPRGGPASGVYGAAWLEPLPGAPTT